MVEKEKLKELCEQRKDRIKEIQLLVKEQNKIKQKIKEVLKDGPKTVPEISNSAGLPKDKTMYFVASLKKYGEILEGDKKGDYFVYMLTQEKLED